MLKVVDRHKDRHRKTGEHGPCSFELAAYKISMLVSLMTECTLFSVPNSGTTISHLCTCTTDLC